MTIYTVQLTSNFDAINQVAATGEASYADVVIIGDSDRN